MTQNSCTREKLQLPPTKSVDPPRLDLAQQQAEKAQRAKLQVEEADRPCWLVGLKKITPVSETVKYFGCVFFLENMNVFSWGGVGTTWDVSNHVNQGVKIIVCIKLLNCHPPARFFSRTCVSCWCNGNIWRSWGCQIRRNARGANGKQETGSQK